MGFLTKWQGYQKRISQTVSERRIIKHILTFNHLKEKETFPKYKSERALDRLQWKAYNDRLLYRTLFSDKA